MKQIIWDSLNSLMIGVGSVILLYCIPYLICRGWGAAGNKNYKERNNIK